MSGAHPIEKRSQLPDTAAAQLQKANELREEGNKLFEGKNFKGAIRKYHNSLFYARAVTNKLSEFSGLLNKTQHATAMEEESAKKLTTALSNNLSGCVYFCVCIFVHACMHACECVCVFVPVCVFEWVCVNNM